MKRFIFTIIFFSIPFLIMAGSIDMIGWTIDPIKSGSQFTITGTCPEPQIIYLGCTYKDSSGNEVDMPIEEIRKNQSKFTFNLYIPKGAKEIIFSLWGKKLNKRQANLSKTDPNYSRLQKMGYIMDQQIDSTGWFNCSRSAGAWQK